MPEPREEAEFHEPVVLPFEMTRPRGLPSGVKKPAFRARRAECFWAASRAVE